MLPPLTIELLRGGTGIKRRWQPGASGISAVHFALVEEADGKVIT
jgi:hypothetical protein